MCGIAGYVGNNSQFPKQKKIKSCILKLKRRGPDSNGVFRLNKKNNNLLLIHTRLSIVDLKKEANQPFCDDEGALIFNGMIYNFIELKKLLIKKKIKFKTLSDTEVLLKLLNMYKEKAFSLLDGMWSISYYNFKNNCLILPAFFYIYHQ